MWFIGVAVEQETSAPPPKKILDPPLGLIIPRGQVVSARSPRIRHQSELTENDWENAVRGLGKNTITLHSV